ncbi:MAG: hypothetical protein AAF483_03140 [Planctomycetota bacterium]
MLKSEPQDVFLRYSLAMEMANDNEVAEALEIFTQLTREEPPYVPSFFRSAQLLADEETEQARAFLRDGIEAARAQNDLHAAGEMSELLAELGGQG